MWIDTGECPEHYHDFVKQPNGRWMVLHDDGSECEATEFDLEREKE